TRLWKVGNGAPSTAPSIWLMNSGPTERADGSSSISVTSPYSVCGESRATICCVSNCASSDIGSNGSTGEIACATSGATMPQNGASTSQMESAASADAAGERMKVENVIASASHTPP